MFVDYFLPFVWWVHDRITCDPFSLNAPRWGLGVTVWIKADREAVYRERLDGLHPDRLGQAG